MNDEDDIRFRYLDGGPPHIWEEKFGSNAIACTSEIVPFLCCCVIGDAERAPKINVSSITFRVENKREPNIHPVIC